MGTVDLDPSNPSIQGHEDRDPQRNGRVDPLRILRKGRVSSTSHGRRFASPRSVDTDTLGRHIPPRSTFFPSRFLRSPSVHAPPLPPRVAGSPVSPFERTLSLPSLPFKGSPSTPESFRLQPIFPPKPSFQTPSTCRPRSTWRVLRRNRSTNARRARKKHLKHVRVVVLPQDPDVVALRSRKKETPGIVEEGRTKARDNVDEKGSVSEVEGQQGTLVKTRNATRGTKGREQQEKKRKARIWTPENDIHRPEGIDTENTQVGRWSERKEQNCRCSTKN